MELCDFNLTYYITKCREMTEGVGDSPLRFAEIGDIFKDIPMELSSCIYKEKFIEI